MMRSVIAALGMMALLLTNAPLAAQGITGDVVKIGIMNDQNGPYADNCGLGSVAAAKLAIADSGGMVAGKKIELVIADDQNKPDVGVAIAMRWLDNEGVDAIVGCSASSIALAVQEITKNRRKPYMLAGTAGSFFTNDKCSPMTTQWVVDTYAQPKATVKALLAQGVNSWFFLTVDYAFGKAWQSDATKFIEAGGGKVVGSVLHPLNASDLSSFLLTAQASGAKAIALANSGSDFANSIKQAQEFGLTKSQLLVPLGLMISQTHGIGLKDLQNVRLTTPFYWDMTPESRAFAKRFADATNGQLLNEGKSATYSAISHYLKAVAAAGSDDGDAVMRQMKNTPVNDFEMKNVSIRADGQVMRPLYVARIKTPAESKYTYDYYEITGTIAPEDAWRPASESACDLLKSQ
ncbi:ABC transporter substrate-binding protein [Bradyrhizobium stylosanthis]|uniref:Amino acid/amide ABC transporter substrate-binding protein (HAAT family) n=1 Tax=Bradyrhizobium stylosanthis TaxID=1803665 RepID=A0A560DYZ2_9BRAD|nr:ABC transporter substrate-binding protein [Bradyrhizobium stylosanthis]TWB02324.1 amino acid/amide ABC transporter substrate-binding protein (HAAT family) [Bradyrhizobium stylosanthis]